MSKKGDSTSFQKRNVNLVKLGRWGGIQPEQPGWTESVQQWALLLKLLTFGYLFKAQLKITSKRTRSVVTAQINKGI